MTTVDHPGRKCPSCQHVLNASDSVGHDHAPDKNDASVCIYCGVVLIYDSPATFHLITAKEELGLPDEMREKLSEIQAGIRMLQRKRGPAA